MKILSRSITWIFILILLVCCKRELFAQDNPTGPTRILFLLDASGSMMAKWEQSNRMSVAKKFLSETIDSLEKIPNLEVALRVYGHQSPRVEFDCTDTRLEVPFSKKNHQEVKNKLNSIRPKGSTPIAYSLEKCAADFPEDPTARNIVILITDGIESCDGDPCAVSLALQRKHIFLKPFIIGIGLSVDVKSAFDCVGTFYDAVEEASFRKALTTVVSQALSTSTTQINLINSKGEPIETNIPFSLFDVSNGIERYSYVHTLNSRRLPDTLLIDPTNTYNLVLHSNPPLEKKNIRIAQGAHTNIDLKVSTGMLDIKISGYNNYKNLRAKVQKPGSNNLVAQQEINTVQKYLVGTYDVEIGTLPPSIFKNQRIVEDETLIIDIPAPGMVTFTSFTDGYGSVFMVKDNDVVKVIDLNSDLKGESMMLQPGNYKVVFRTKKGNASIFTVERFFTVKSKENQSVRLN